MDKDTKCPYCGSTDTKVIYFCIGLGEENSQTTEQAEKLLKDYFMIWRYINV